MPAALQYDQHNSVVLLREYPPHLRNSDPGGIAAPFQDSGLDNPRSVRTRMLCIDYRGRLYFVAFWGNKQASPTSIHRTCYSVCMD
jgi:hypothetical protein